jgi:hypothetical protein
VPNVAAYYNTLPSPGQHLLHEWAASISREQLNLFVAYVQQYLTMRVLSQTAEEVSGDARPYASNGDPKIGLVTQLLGLFWRANIMRVPKTRRNDDIVVVEGAVAGTADMTGDDDNMLYHDATDTGAAGDSGAAAASAAGASGSLPSSSAGAEADMVQRAAELQSPTAPLPVEDFVNETLCEHMHMAMDILQWKRVLRADDDSLPVFRVSFAETAPFVLDTATKAKCLNTENRFRQRLENTNLMQVRWFTGGCADWRAEKRMRTCSFPEKCACSLTEIQVRMLISRTSARTCSFLGRPCFSHTVPQTRCRFY